MAKKGIPLNVGPMQAILIEYDPITGQETPPGGTEMPPTEGGTTLTFNFETLDSTADQTGSFARASYFVGGEATITCNFTEIGLEDVLKLFPVYEIDESGGGVVKIPIGADVTFNPPSLLLRPIIEGEVSTDDDLAIYAPCVTPIPNFDTEFSLKTQRIWTVDFKVLPYDPVNGDMTMLALGKADYDPDAGT